MALPFSKSSQWPEGSHGTCTHSFPRPPTSPALGPTTAPLPTAFSPRTPLCSLPPPCQVFALMSTHPGCHLWPPFQITAPIPGMPYPPSLLNVSPFLRSPSLHSVVHPTTHFVCPPCPAPGNDRAEMLAFSSPQHPHHEERYPMRNRHSAKLLRKC